MNCCKRINTMIFLSVYNSESEIYVKISSWGKKSVSFDEDNIVTIVACSMAYGQNQVLATTFSSYWHKG
jgi:hypothetical protein